MDIKFKMYIQKNENKCVYFDELLEKFKINLDDNNKSIFEINEKFNQTNTSNKKINIQNLENLDSSNNCEETIKNNNGIEANDKIKEDCEDELNDNNQSSIIKQHNKAESQISLNTKMITDNYNNHDKNLKTNFKDCNFVFIKDFQILKTNIEMNFNSIKNEIKNQNKDITERFNELKISFNEKFSKISFLNKDYNNLLERESNFDEIKKNAILNSIQNPLSDEELSSSKNVHKNFLNYANTLYSNKRILSKNELNNLEMDDIHLGDEILTNKIKELEHRIDELDISRNKVNYEKIDKENLKENSHNSIYNIHQILVNSKFVDFLNEKIISQLKKFEKNNSTLNTIKEDISKNKEDINNLYESILSLRKVINDKLEKNFVDVEYFNKIITEMDEKMKIEIEFLDRKTNEDNKILTKLNDYVNETTINLLEIKGFIQTGHLMKEYFNYFIKNIKILQDKTDRNSMRLDNISGEIINKLRNDLWSKNY